MSYGRQPRAWQASNNIIRGLESPASCILAAEKAGADWPEQHIFSLLGCSFVLPFLQKPQLFCSCRIFSYFCFTWLLEALCNRFVTCSLRRTENRQPVYVDLISRYGGLGCQESFQTELAAAVAARASMATLICISRIFCLRCVTPWCLHRQTRKELAQQG
jgi:hypothetical protein